MSPFPLSLMNYPDGIQMKRGDLVWWNEGGCVGYVQSIAETPEEYTAWGLDGPHAFLAAAHPYDPTQESGVAYPPGCFEDEAIGLMTEDEAAELRRAITEAGLDDGRTFATTTEVYMGRMTHWVFCLMAEDGIHARETIRIPLQRDYGNGMVSLTADEAVDVSFRPAVAADADGVVEAYLASRLTYLPYAPPAHTDPSIRMWIADTLIPHGGVAVAVRGHGATKEIIGMTAVSRDGAVDWIDQFYLHPAAVGRGIGGRLLERTLEGLGPVVRLYTFQRNEESRRFYERHGFRALEFSDGQANEERCPDVLYELRR